MRFNWEKQGIIYCPQGESAYFKTHAARPIPYKIDEQTLRIYFTARDHDDRPVPSYIDVELKNPKNILHVNQEPLIDLGKLGRFDDSGITMACILNVNQEQRVYYTGWKRRRINVTFEFSIGLAHLINNFGLARKYEGPILAQNKEHPILVAGPFVMYSDNKFRMWYCSGESWKVIDSNPEPVYLIHYAESTDGIYWRSAHNGPILGQTAGNEVLSAPWVIRSEHLYHMWYSYRGISKLDKFYVIGYAESVDGLNWERKDQEVGIALSAAGWDSQMLCYPAFFPYQDQMYMFYSGNNVGRAGMGFAVAENFLIS